MDGHSDDQVRIPVRFIDGEWRYLYGGPLPVSAGAAGELVVYESAIDDPKFLSKIRRQSVHKILGESAVLLVALAVRPDTPVSAELKKHLIPADPMRAMVAAEFFASTRMHITDFVEIAVGPLAPHQKSIGDSLEGGVWLVLEGTRARRIKCSQIFVPGAVSEQPLGSLNQALTRLSEVYEPWRISHTGSIYARICYRGDDSRWYPLETLREAVIADIERSLALDSEAKSVSAPAAEK